MKPSGVLSRLHWQIEDALLNAMVQRDANNHVSRDFSEFQFQNGRVRAYVDALQVIQQHLNLARAEEQGQ